MGIDISIGQLAVGVEAMDNKELYVYGRAKEAKHPNAPDFPNMNGYSLMLNHLSMSYTAWDGFLRKVGLVKEDFTIQYSGVILVTPALLQNVADARYRWQVAHPHAQPGYWDFEWQKLSNGDTELVETDTQYDYVLATLLRLEGWLNWAYRTQAQPVVYSY